MLCKWKFGDFFIHFDQGDKTTEGEKKMFSFLKCIQKSNVILKNWVLVFSFMYLVSVDPMDRSIIIQVNWVRFEFETKSNLSTYYWFSVQLELTATDFLMWRLYFSYWKKNNASFILNISTFTFIYFLHALSVITIMLSGQNFVKKTARKKKKWSSKMV